MPGTLIMTSKAPGDPELERAVALAKLLADGGNAVAILFVGDGVYSLISGAVPSVDGSSIGPNVKRFACLPDIRARGLSDKILSEVRAVSYDEIVDLIMEEYSSVISYL